MELQGKPVQVTNVEWAKVMVEVVIEEGVVDREVVRLSVCWLLHCLGTVSSPLGALAGGADGRLWIRKKSIFRRCVYI